MKRVKRFLSAVAAGQLACLALSCEDPLDFPQVISELRVLAARVEPDEDPGRAWVFPGESVTVRWLVVAPHGHPIKTFGLLACVAEKTSRGVPRCQAGRFAEVLQAVPTEAEPRLSFVVPAAEQFTTTDRISVLGVVCSAGIPLLSETAAELGCTDSSAVAQRVSYDLTVTGLNVNRHPDISDVALRLDGVAWNSSDGDTLASSSDCDETQTSAALPRVVAGRSPALIQVALPARSREALVATPTHRNTLETLQISHFSDLGLLERPFSSVPAAHPEPNFSISWEVPAEAPAQVIARFYFVVRDGRGGTSWVSRALCVVP